MRGILYGVFFLIVGLFSCLPAVLAQQVIGSGIVIEEKSFDAREVKEGEVIEHTFTVKNRGDEVLEIRKVSPGWGCAVARYDGAIPPGGEGSVTLRIKTGGYQGEIIKRARIFTNDPRTKVEVVDIKAFVKAPIYISPRFVHLNGPAGQTVVGIVSVRAGEERPLRIEESSFDIKTKVTYAIEEVEAGRFFRIRFTAIPGPPGTFRGVLRLKTNYPEKPQIVIPITARLHGAGKAQKGREN